MLRLPGLGVGILDVENFDGEAYLQLAQDGFDVGGSSVFENFLFWGFRGRPRGTPLPEELSGLLLCILVSRIELLLGAKLCWRTPNPKV